MASRHPYVRVAARTRSPWEELGGQSIAGFLVAGGAPEVAADLVAARGRWCTAPDDKVPPVPPRHSVREPEDVLGYTGTLWRIHRTRGEFVLPWNGFRSYGPLADMRFDPHPDGPPRDHADVGGYITARRTSQLPARRSSSRTGWATPPTARPG